MNDNVSENGGNSLRKIKNYGEYLRKRGYKTEGLTENEMRILSEELHNKLFYEGYNRRLEKLKEAGKVKEKIEKCGICKHCGKEYSFIVRDGGVIYNYINDGYCSFECYKKSGQYMVHYKTQVVLNVKGKVDNLDEDFRSIVSKNVSKRLRKFAEKKKKEDPDYFSNIAKLGNKNRREKFLVENDIIDDISNMDDDSIRKLFKEHFNKITNHSDKVRKGIYEKHKDIKSEYGRRYKKGLENYISSTGIDISSISNEEYDKFKIEFNKKHSMNDKKLWKLSHLKNRNIDVDESNPDDIDIKYSEYISDRNILAKSIHNGYRRTNKGWFEYKNIKVKMFYRSSWEKIVFETIDDLIGSGFIIDVGEPRRIEYFYEYKRYYHNRGTIRGT